MLTPLFTVVSHSPAETEKAGEHLADKLRGGEILSLLGELGSGKTTFVKGLARALGVNPREVVSPSFVIYSVYKGAHLELYHVDLYRLEKMDHQLELEVFEAAHNGAVVAVEWAERSPDIINLSKYIIKFEAPSEDKRIVKVEEQQP